MNKYLFFLLLINLESLSPKDQKNEDELWMIKKAKMGATFFSKLTFDNEVEFPHPN